MSSIGTPLKPEGAGDGIDDPDAEVHAMVDKYDAPFGLLVLPGDPMFVLAAWPDDIIKEDPEVPERYVLADKKKALEVLEAHLAAQTAIKKSARLIVTLLDQGFLRAVEPELVVTDKRGN